MWLHLESTVGTTPSIIGRYQILDRIGQGGMGSLFRAWDPMLEREIAIKLLRDDNDELRERFSREARSAARLRHRNIVTIFDVGEQDGYPFIAMEYIRGQTLADLIRAGALITAPQKLQIIDELCDGLAFAHKAGIVHRDVKPPNVMVEHDGAVKILDFGIVRLAESGMTQAGMLIGTVNYMSPEQVAGRPVDRRSDIFAVGAVLYELMSCQQAFQGGLHTGILHRILHQPPPPLTELCSDVDPAVVEIVDKALAKDPDERYQSLSDMRSDLQRVQARLAAHPPETVQLRAPAADTTKPEAPTAAARRAQTPRRGASREDLARRRATQIAAHIEHAHQALAEGEYEVAMASAEQALLLDAEEPEALEILDRARSTLEERRLLDMVRRGEEWLRAGALTEARRLAEQALTLTPESPLANAFREAVDAARRRREQEEAARLAMERARSLLQSGALDDAAAAVAEALRLEPDGAEAAALREQVRVEQERLQHEARAAALIQEAERAFFEEGRHAEALGALDAFQPAHHAVSTALARLRQEKDRLDRERQEAQLRAEQAAAALAAARRTASHDEAVKILEEAQQLDPDHADLGRELADRRVARDEEIRLAQERRERVDAAIALAEGTAAHEEAVGYLEQALEIDPKRAEVRRLLAERRGALEGEREAARLAQERAATIAAALAEAEATPAHEAALAILRRAAALDPPHQAVQEQLAARQAALDHEQAEIRQAQERQRRIERALSSAARTTSHEAAIRLLEDALRVDAGADALEAALVRRRADRHEEIRQAEERRRQVAAAVALANEATSHEEALGRLEGALAIDPSNADVQRLLRERRAALEEEREARRRAEEREARIAAVVAQAQATDSHDKAVAILERALAVDAGDARLQTLLGERTAARDHEREELRQQRERAATIAAALKQARRAASHEAALDILAEALALDPEHGEARAMQAAREAALERQRREAEQAAAIASLVRHVDALVDQHQLDEAETAIGQADASLRSAKALKAAQRRLAKARAARARTEKAASGASGSLVHRLGARLPPSSRATAALVLVVMLTAVVGFATRAVLLRPTSSPHLDPVDHVSPADLQLSGDAAPNGAAAAPEPPPPLAPVTTEPDEPSGEPDVNPAVVAAVRQGQQQIATGNLRQALSTIAGGLQAEPQNPELRKLLGEVVAKARQEAVSARSSAARHGDAASAASAFGDGTARFEEAGRHARAGRAERAAALYWESAALFGKAEVEAREVMARAAAAPAPPPAAPPPSVSLQPEPSASTPPAAKPEPAPPARTEPAPTTTSPAAGAAPAAAARAADEAGIRAALRAYEQAYSKLDVEAVRRVFPSINASLLDRTFRDLRSQAVKIDITEPISITGTTATVVCDVALSVTPRAGSGTSATIPSVFRLQKVGDHWIITERR